MSVVNKATVRRLYEEAFAQGKPEVVDEVLDANFVCHDPNSETDISHLQVALSGFIIALGVTVIALAWYGIRHGERWALLTAFLGPVIAVAVAVSLHFPYGIATIGHLGLIYLDALILVVGTVLAYGGLRKGER
jgi:apolipoprotein N-acyltransferase